MLVIIGGKMPPTNTTLNYTRCVTHLITHWQSGVESNTYSLSITLYRCIRQNKSTEKNGSGDVNHRNQRVLWAISFNVVSRYATSSFTQSPFTSLPERVYEYFTLIHGKPYLIASTLSVFLPVHRYHS